MNSTIIKLMEGTVVRELFYSVDYWHVFLVIESIDQLKHEFFTICFRDCNIIKWSISTRTLNMRIGRVDFKTGEDERKMVHVISQDNDNDELVLSCSEIVKMEK